MHVSRRRRLRILMSWRFKREHARAWPGCLSVFRLRSASSRAPVFWADDRRILFRFAHGCFRSVYRSHCFGSVHYAIFCASRGAEGHSPGLLTSSIRRALLAVLQTWPRKYSVFYVDGGLSIRDLRSDNAIFSRKLYSQRNEVPVDPG